MTHGRERLRLGWVAYRLPLRLPLRAGEVALRERRGLIVTLREPDGAIGHGDIAPLPGLHAESLADCERALARLAPALEASPRLAELEPSVRFGLECARLDLDARRQGTTPARLLAMDAPPRIVVSGLFDGDAAAAREALAARVLHSYAVVKVKVGRQPLAVDREVLATLHAGLPTSTRLRLDANRALTLDAACQLVAGLEPRLEHLEEPLRDPGELAALHAATGLGLALDETLHEPGRAALCTQPCVKAWIVKPSLSGLAHTLELAARARQHGIACVLSACFDSGLGLALLAQIAAAVSPAIAHGLGTDRWLADDVLEPRFSSAAGSVDVAAWPPPLEDEG